MVTYLKHAAVCARFYDLSIDAREVSSFVFKNYEDTKIRETGYFNGLVSCADHLAHIERRSTTELISEQPFVVRWDAQYAGQFNGQEFSFVDSMLHRAFSRNELCALLPRFGFKLIEQGENFDETSFYTLAEAV